MARMAPSLLALLCVLGCFETWSVAAPTGVEFKCGSYFVHDGDYLCNITDHYSVSINQILAANPPVLKPIANTDNTIDINDYLMSNITINLPCPFAPCCPTWTYAAKSDESFYSISQQFNVKLDQLISLNVATGSFYHDAYNLSCGDSVLIPCRSTDPQCTSLAPTPGPSYPFPALHPPAEAPQAFSPVPAPVVAPAPRLPPPPAPSPLPLSPRPPPPPPPFAPQLVQFTLTDFTGQQVSSDHLPRGFNCDTDYVILTSTVNGTVYNQWSGPSMRVCKGQQRVVKSNISLIITNPNDVAAFGYVIMNSGAGAFTSRTIDGLVNGVAKYLSAAPFGSSTAVEVGNLFSYAASLLGNIRSLTDCDGIVAADGVRFKASDYMTLLAQGRNSYTRTFTHGLCGAESRYNTDSTFGPRT